MKGSRSPDLTWGVDCDELQIDDASGMGSDADASAESLYSGLLVLYRTLWSRLGSPYSKGYEWKENMQDIRLKI